MKLKDFLMICDYSDCIFEVNVVGRTEPIVVIENVKDKSELEKFFDDIVCSIYPWNENTIGVAVYIDVEDN